MAAQEGLPIRHEFYDAADPQHPIYIPSSEEISIQETSVERRYVGLPTEEIVFRHYLNLN